MKQKSQQKNRLFKEASLYLQQHAQNPVDWYPWGDEAFTVARAQNKPILVSTGYSACHWCHVMEEQSFENSDIAALQNELFVSIKIDREERPDLDHVFMSAVQAMTGRGGWPLHVFLTPEGNVFFGGTYFPPTRQRGMPSWPDVLRHVSHFYHEKKDDLQDVTREIQSRLQSLDTVGDELYEISDQPAALLVDQLHASFDPGYGGFGQAPKFPHGQDLSFLLRWYRRKNEDRALQMVRVTCDRMARGGMYDQLGGGFHRYSTDEKWLVPHFEKMLYDNGVLLSTYAETFACTRQDYFKEICLETAEYLQREMQDTNGAFYAAQDADSEGHEGTYFVWSPDSLREVLPEDQAKLVGDFFGVSNAGNFENGQSVLHVARDVHDLAKQYHLTVQQISNELTQARQKLLEKRQTRVAPATDPKIITSWNALAISGLAKAGRFIDDENLITMAEQAVTFFISKFETGFLPHVSYVSDTNKKSQNICSFFEDYSYLMAALLDLFDATAKVLYLDLARRVLTKADDLFLKQGSKIWSFTPIDETERVANSTPLHDGATPSAVGLMVHSLLRLGRVLQDQTLIDRVHDIQSRLAMQIKSMPRVHTTMTTALIELLARREDIVIVGPKNHDEMKKCRGLVQQSYHPFRSVVCCFTDDFDYWQKQEAYQGKLVNEGVTAYFCRDFVCDQPVMSFKEFEARWHQA